MDDPTDDIPFHAYIVWAGLKTGEISKFSWFWIWRDELPWTQNKRFTFGRKGLTQPQLSPINN